MRRWLTLGIVGMSLWGCASAPPPRDDRGASEEELAAFAAAVDVALDAREVELPTRAETLADIRLLTRAYDLTRACAPGRGAFSPAWVEENRDRQVQTQAGRRSVGELAKTCEDLLAGLEHRPVEACGSRFLQIERFSDSARRWSAPRVARASEGWYMTPCDQRPSQNAARELKEAEAELKAACAEPEAGIYLLARWAEDESSGRKVATVACMLPLRSRSDWLPGNPALGVR